MRLKNLDCQEFSQIFAQIIDGEIAKDNAKEILLKLNEIGFSANMFLGAMQVLKSRMTKVRAPKNAIDVCGTGGDKLNSLNISTAMSFVVAGCGAVVAKHGNKAISSNSGSADIFKELGIKISDDIEKIEQNLSQNNLAFIFAPFFHKSLKNIAQIRQEIAKEYGVPTIFNYLGPLLNPANVKRQFIGTSKLETMPAMALALQKSGCKAAYITHGFDNMDEITLCDDSYLLRLEDDKISETQIINPEKFGFKKCKIDDIKGKDPKYNAAKLRQLLQGEKSFYRDIVLLNSAFALKVAGVVDDVEVGIEKARNAIDNGDALGVLKLLGGDIKNHIN